MKSSEVFQSVALAAIKFYAGFFNLTVDDVSVEQIDGLNDRNTARLCTAHLKIHGGIKVEGVIQRMRDQHGQMKDNWTAGNLTVTVEDREFDGILFSISEDGTVRLEDFSHTLRAA